jgi:DNA polymerase-3 subunit delta'
MWMDLVGHDAVADRFRHILAEGRLASTYLFVGPGGVGKRQFARRLAECLFCPNTADEELTACGQCASCQLMAAGNHPDLLEVTLKKDKRALQIDQFVGDGEHRNREGLCHDISMRPALSNRRVAVIDHADTFNVNTANALLKTLEEPPPRSLIILIGTSESRQLPTIRSRAQIMRFAPLGASEMASLLVEKGLVGDAAVATRVAELADGSLDQAQAMATDELWEVHTEAVGVLNQPVIDSVHLGKIVHQYAESAGKEASAKRDALIAVLSLVARHYRRNLRADPASPEMPRILARIDRCLDAEYQVDRNVHLQTVIQSWADDLARG